VNIINEGKLDAGFNEFPKDLCGVGAAIIKAIKIIQSDNTIFLSNLILLKDISFQPSSLFEEINL